MNWHFNEKVALVTGAASGIGLATAKAFAQAGAAVILADVHEDMVRSAAEELVSAGHKAIAIRCNVADETEVAAMVEQTVSSFGPAGRGVQQCRRAVACSGNRGRQRRRI